jgi:Tfp pilus assembly protein PilV
MSPYSPKNQHPRGFALTITLILMVLLTVLAVGMLSLSAVSLRSSFQGSAQSEARSNARLALMLAIGELQKQMGPDQRVSASGAIISDSPVMHPHWTGVWDSWQAGDTSSGADAKSEHSTIAGASNSGMAPTYEAQRKDHFRTWLLSLNPEEATEATLPATLALDGVPMPDGNQSAVRLVGDGSLGTVSGMENYVSARLISVKAQSTGSAASGRYAWWVGDESQKARIMADSFALDGSLTAAERISRSQAPGSTGTKRIKGLENLVSEEQLGALSSFQTVNLLEANPPRPPGQDEPSQTNFHSITTRSLGVLADVREGGLKRDLNTLLEQPIDIEDTDMIDKHVLYRFSDPRFPNDAIHSQVPIQDLSAYYQLYDDDPAFSEGRKGGIRYTSSSIGMTAPDFGNNPGNALSKKKYMREHTALYRNPVPIRVQFVVAIIAQRISDFDREYGAWTRDTGDSDGDGNTRDFVPVKRSTPISASQTHKLVTAITPVVTLWNPNNVSMTLNRGAAVAQVMKMTSPAAFMEWTKYRGDVSGPPITSDPVHLMYMATGHNAWHLYSEMVSMSFSEDVEVTFEPGEVKIFSIPTPGQPLATNETLYQSGWAGNGIQRATAGWDPFGLSPMIHSASGGQDVFGFVSADESERTVRNLMSFGPADAITYSVRPEDLAGGQRNVSIRSKAAGSAFNFWLMNKPYTNFSYAPSGEHFINYMFTSRCAGNITGSMVHSNNAIMPFNQDFMARAFPDGQQFIPAESKSESMTGQDIINATASNEGKTLFQFTMTASCEVSGNSQAFNNAGRSTLTRPFTHGSIIAPPFVDQLDPSSLYTYGWEWQLEPINSMDEAPIQSSGENSYFGGGLTPEFGTTHVVQRDIPILPPISIAALSHAHLGGFSLGNEPAVEFNNSAQDGMKRILRDITRSQGYQRVTAFGQAGLAPHTMQAIGNSYAHPKVPADKAYTTWTRHFDMDTNTPSQLAYIDPQVPTGGVYEVPCVDHSYLANKALWDEYFFSSITPQLSKIPLYSGAMSAEQVARGFFFNNEPLPNRRFTPHLEGFTEDDLVALFQQDPLAADGLCDSIAAHMMVEGPFNINSTSVEAWKVFLSSHRGKPTNILDGGSSPTQFISSQTPVGFGSMANGEPIGSEETADPAAAGQWKSARELSDDEIDQLAQAIVHQVKLRGPFLSLSEFVNRRLDPDDTEFSLKGALQAALDFEGDGTIPEVTINKTFRADERKLDGEITAEIRNSAAFPEAFEGPVAYGSAPYVDQADILRGFAGQLTPRGDTFVIRTYGDSMDPSGNVKARAWCEAVVQRTPNYTDPTQDKNHAAASDLQSDVNRGFGRRFTIVSFRWLNADEI